MRANWAKSNTVFVGYYGNYGVKYDQNNGGSVWEVNDNMEHVQDFEPPPTAPNYSSPQMYYPNLEEETKYNQPSWFGPKIWNNIYI